MAETTEAITRVSGDIALNDSLKDPPVNRHPPPVAPRPTDTVALSDTAKATLLRNEGETVEEIASALNLSVSQIVSDLQLAKVATQTSTTASPGVDSSNKTKI